MEKINLPKTVEQSRTENTKKTGLIIRSLKTVNWWWITRVVLTGAFVILRVSPYGAYQLWKKTIKDIDEGKCFEQKPVTQELKSLSKIGLKGYLRYHWEEIKDFLLSCIL